MAVAPERGSSSAVGDDPDDDGTSRTAIPSCSSSSSTGGAISGNDIDTDNKDDHDEAAAAEKGVVATPDGTNASGLVPAPEQGGDPFEVSFEGGDSDIWSPRSHSNTKKWIITLIVACASFCVTSASSIYTSTYDQMQSEFHCSKEVLDVGLSLFVLGISLGPMFLGPLSEFYGRRPIYLVTWTLYLIWIIPEAVATNIQTVLVGRFFDGFCGSAFLAVSGGTVSDLFARHELQLPMAVFSVAPFIGPSMGPLIGGFINSRVNWRWTYYVLLIWSFAILAALAALVPETFHPIVLRNKARKLRSDTGNDRFWAPMERKHKSVLHAISLSLLRPFQLLIFEPMCLNLCLLSAFLLGIIYLFFVAFPLVFETNHGFSLWQVGLAFSGILVGMLLAILTDGIWQRVRMRLMRRLEEETGVPGSMEPEFRLPPTIAGACLAPIGLFIFAWSTYSSVPWIVPIIGSAIFGAGVVLSFTGIFTFLVDAYPNYAASALAANAFLRCLFAAVFPLFGTQMYEGMGYQWASTLIAFLTLVMAPFPWIFFKYGKRIRAKSRYAKS